METRLQAPAFVDTDPEETPEQEALRSTHSLIERCEWWKNELDAILQRRGEFPSAYLFRVHLGFLQDALRLLLQHGIDTGPLYE